jgi:hypothetical protein
MQRTATKEYRAAWREQNREQYNAKAREWRKKNKIHLSFYMKNRRRPSPTTKPVIVADIAAFEIAPCGAEYDPVACPLRHKSGLLRECRECVLFKENKR